MLGQSVRAWKFMHLRRDGYVNVYIWSVFHMYFFVCFLVYVFLFLLCQDNVFGFLIRKQGDKIHVASAATIQARMMPCFLGTSRNFEYIPFHLNGIYTRTG